MPDEAGYRRSLHRLIQLRWVASVLVLLALAVGKLRVPSFDLRLAIGVGLAIPASNLVHGMLARSQRHPRSLLLGQFGADLLLLTLLLAATGGIDGPTGAPFVLHVLLAALLLSVREAVLLAALAVGLAGSLAAAQIFFYPSAPGLFSAVMSIDPPLNRVPAATLGRVVMLAAVSAVNLLLVIPVVSESRRRSALLREAEATATARLGLLQKLLNETGASMLVMDDQHRLIWSNHPDTTWFGTLRAGEKRPCYASKTGRPEKAGEESQDCATCQVIASSEARRMDYASSGAADGLPRVISVFATPLEEAGQRGVVEYIRDVTADRQREVQLVEARRAAATAVLAAGVAHELSTPLASLALGLRTASRACERSNAQAPVKEGNAELLRDLEAQVARCQEIAQSMLGLSRRLEGRMTTARARTIVNDAISELGVRRNLRGIDIEVVGSAAAMARCDPRHLQLALLNILANAVDSLRESKPSKPRIHVEITAFGLERTQVRIEDNGAGMSAEVRARVLEPFFTTKAAAEGSGLGLAVTETLLATMGGTISIESTPASGTFVVVGLQGAQPGDAIASSADLCPAAPEESPW